MCCKQSRELRALVFAFVAGILSVAGTAFAATPALLENDYSDGQNLTDAGTGELTIGNITNSGNSFTGDDFTPGGGVLWISSEITPGTDQITALKIGKVTVAGVSAASPYSSTLAWSGSNGATNAYGPVMIVGRKADWSTAKQSIAGFAMSNIRTNYAVTDGAGSGVSAFGGGAYISNLADLEVGTSSFANISLNMTLDTTAGDDTDYHVNGGALAMLFDEFSTGKVKLDDITFTGNTASIAKGSDYSGTTGFVAARGGALSIFRGGSTTSLDVTIDGGSFNNNTAKNDIATMGAAYGGAIFSEGAALSLKDVTFSNNAAQAADAKGGAIYTTGGLTLDGVTFSGNYVSAADGTGEKANAIYLAGANVTFTGSGISTDNDGIAGTGNIIKNGTGVLNLFGAYSYTGGIQADAGTINFKGGADQTFTGTISVASGATISLEKGTGNVTANTINTISGSSVVAKALASTGNNSAHFISNTAYIADAGVKYYIGGTLRENEQYIIITETGASLSALGSGNQIGSTINSFWADYNVYENGNVVWAEMVAGSARSLAGFATTPNNKSIAEAVVYGTDLYDYIRTSFTSTDDAAAMNRVLALASGEAMASASSALIGYSSQTAGMIMSQARNAWSNQMVEDSPTSGLGYASVRSVCGGPRIWAELDGFYSKGRDTNNTYRGKTKGYGVAIGLDGVVGDWLLGVGFRYGDGRLKVDALRSRTDFDSYSGSVYAGRRFVFEPGALYVTGGYSFGYHDIDGRRRDIVDGTYKSDYHGRSHTGYLDMEFAFGDRCWKVAPFANVLYNSYRNSSFTERRSGGVSDALHVSARTKGNFSTNLGLRVKADVGDHLFVDADAAWRHTYGSIQVSNRTNFVGQNQRFSVIGNAMARDEVVYGAGIGVKLTERAMIRAAYDGSYGDKTYSHQGTVSFSLNF